MIALAPFAFLLVATDFISFLCAVSILQLVPFPCPAGTDSKSLLCLILPAGIFAQSNDSRIHGDIYSPAHVFKAAI